MSVQTRKSATPPRRTQAQRSGETQRRILDAAIHCLLDRGYAGASTAAIQHAAGVSRGALTHHFPSRITLMTAAVRHLSGLRRHAVGERLAETPAGDARVAWIFRLVWQAAFDNDLFFVVAELWVAARSDPTLRRALQETERELDRDSRRGIAHVLGPEMAGRPNFENALEIVMRLMRGAALVNFIRESRPETSDFIDECARVFRSELDRPAAAR